MQHFDERAQNWGDDPKKVKRAIIIADQIKASIKLSTSMKALEFGCGTGLLSYQLKDLFKSITLIDNSEEMINVLNEKIKNEGIEHFDPVLIDLLYNDLAQNDFDVVYTLMSLHHILDLNKILKTFHSVLKSDGFLCIADLVQEDGSFHDEHLNFEGHNGFDKSELRSILSNNGFKMLSYQICLDIEKEVNDSIKNYPLFLMVCKKE